MTNCPHCGQSMPLLAQQEIKTKRKRGKVTFDQWLESIGDTDPIPANHHSLKYAETIGLPMPFVELAWDWFENRYRGTRDLYADWGAHFRKSLEGCYSKYWQINRENGEFFLTLQGRQAKILKEKNT